MNAFERSVLWIFEQESEGDDRLEIVITSTKSDDFKGGFSPASTVMKHRFRKNGKWIYDFDMDSGEQGEAKRIPDRVRQLLSSFGHNMKSESMKINKLDRIVDFLLEQNPPQTGQAQPMRVQTQQPVQQQQGQQASKQTQAAGQQTNQQQGQQKRVQDINTIIIKYKNGEQVELSPTKNPQVYQNWIKILQQNSNRM